MRVRTGAVGAAALGIVLLAACTSGSAIKSNANGGDAVVPAAGPAAAMPNAGYSDGKQQAGDSTGAPAPGGGGSAVRSGKTPLTSAAVIRTASITVRVQNLSAADQVAAIAAGAGGTVDGDNRSSGKNATATLVLAVPPQQLGAVLAQIARLGSEQARQLTSQDVTEQVADVDSRVRSAQESIARLRLLFTHAVKVGDILAIENELATREADLESLQAQQRTLQRQTSMAHVTVMLTTGDAAKHKDRTGFVGGLRRGWDAFVDGATATLTGLGAIVPFAVLLAVVGAAVLIPVRRRRRPAPPAPDSA